MFRLTIYTQGGHYSYSTQVPVKEVETARMDGYIRYVRAYDGVTVIIPWGKIKYFTIEVESAANR